MDSFEDSKDMSEEERELAEKIRSESTLSILGSKWKSEFEVNEALRREKEIEWAQDLRAAKGIYDPDILKRIPDNASKVYPKYTRSKEVPAIAKLNNMLFPAIGKNWEIMPTPEPLLSDTQMNKVLTEIGLKNAGTDKEITTDDVAKAIKVFAIKAGERMSRVMDDQLVESRYVEVDKKVIRSGIRYGTGVKKGPLSRSVARSAVENTDGEIKQVKKKERIPTVEFVPIWNWYPDMTATDYEHCEHTFELHCMSKHQLRQLAKREDFKGDIIKEYIKNHPNGDYIFKSWEVDLYNIGDKVLNKADLRRYQVLERWGYIDGMELAEAGMDIPEDKLNSELEVVAFVLGGQIIKLKLAPTPIDPTTQENNKVYHLFYFEKDESSIFGSGLPRAIRDSALSICAAARMLLNNAAKVTGPISEVNIDLLAPGEAIDDLNPEKVIQREGRGIEAQYPAFRAINLESHIPEYIQIISLFKSFGDDESTMPAFLWGEATAGSNETARGISIKSSNTNITIGDIVKSFDASNESFLRALYHWNMEFNTDESIKGDFNVKAKGFSSLLSKEMRTQALDYFASTLTPADEPYIKRLDFLTERVKAQDLDPDTILRTEEEAMQFIESQRDKDAQALSKANAEAEIVYTHSKAAHMNAKAEKTDTENQIETVKALTGEDEEKKI